jgi:hypothetical protein
VTYTPPKDGLPVYIQIGDEQRQPMGEIPVPENVGRFLSGTMKDIIKFTIEEQIRICTEYAQRCRDELARLETMDFDELADKLAGE